MRSWESVVVTLFLNFSNLDGCMLDVAHLGSGLGMNANMIDGDTYFLFLFLFFLILFSCLYFPVSTGGREKEGRKEGT
ncbi:hypothetical protein HOY82DRAFT_544802, partial [Tuber indicum]